MAKKYAPIVKAKLVLAGAGNMGLHWLDKLKREGVDVFCFVDRDKNKIGQELCGKKIISYCELNDIQDAIDIFITVENKSAREEIEAVLSGMGLGSRIIGHFLYEDCNISPQARIQNSFLAGNNLILEEAELSNSYLGMCSYLAAGAKLVNVKVGKYSCIGPEVKVILGQHPVTGIVSVHPAFYSTKNVIGYSYVKQDKFIETRIAAQEYSVIIGNDVWIGMGAHIMEGVTVADGSIIAAGAVVIRNTEPFEVVGGVPARHIKYRFSKEERDKLLEVQWWDKDLEWIMEHAEEFEDIKKFCSI
ncbi:MAG: CatB-related O-acetyltransferase [Ruminococcus flavefaciens]|nr:CatB-related O-acetyltransferase [Ruminococcus flavefaciens]